jgi:hypothetical protein
MMVWVLVLADALAADANLASCCTAVGAAACPDQLTVVGPASSQAPAQQGVSVTGAWTLTCSTGATWDGLAATTVSKTYATGTVLTPMLPAAAACFEVSCALPTGACLHNDGKRTWVAGCGDAHDLSDAQWRAPTRPGRPAAVVAGRVLGATIQPGQPGDGQAGGTVPAPAPTAAVDSTVPSAPPDRCNTSPTLREPSNQQVDAGNEAVVQGKLAEAADRYRAAISINPCNAFGWAALGEVLKNAGHPTQAAAALGAATRLMPTNFHAWMVLGSVREQQRDVAGAVQAYQRALVAKPGHPPAAEALARLGM